MESKKSQSNDFLFIIFRYTVIAVNTLGFICLILIVCDQIKSATKSDDEDNLVINNEVTIPLINEGLVCSDENNCKEATIFIGKITPDTFLSIRDSLDKILARGDLCFLSGGGDAEAMIDIAKLVKENQISVCSGDIYKINAKDNSGTEVIRKFLNPPCLSACGFIIMSGDVRNYYGENPQIGLHSPSTTLDLCLCEIKVFFPSFGVDNHILELAENESKRSRKKDILNYYTLSKETENEDMYILSKEELSRFNVFNNQITTTDF
jgi:hypothetical protein